MMNFNILTLNLCLGLKNKKDLVKNILIQNKIGVLSMQETEVERTFDKTLLRIPGFTLELEENSVISRVGFYISNDFNYKRVTSLEGEDSNVIIVDIDGKNPTRIINVYRSFNPQNGESQREKFKYQLSLIKKAFVKGTILLGDFNLDFLKKHCINYANRNLLDDFDDVLSDLNLIQMVNCTTWSRIVNNCFKESLLDHIYVTDPTIGNSITTVKPCFGDHLLVIMEWMLNKPTVEIIFKRDWRKYSKDILCNHLNEINWNYEYDSVQSFWDYFENMLIKIVDKIVPSVPFVNNRISQPVPRFIKEKINKRNRLLKKRKSQPSANLRKEIGNLNAEIHTFYFTKKKSSVRNGILPGNSKSLWTAVKLAKDIGAEQIPTKMNLKGIPVEGSGISDCFATFFDEKNQFFIINCTADFI